MNLGFEAELVVRRGVEETFRRRLTLGLALVGVRAAVTGKLVPLFLWLVPF